MIVYGSMVEFGVLGPVEVRDSGRRKQLGGRKQRTVLALLLANLSQRTSTDRLVEGVYGDEAPDGARRSIQTYVSNLRSEIGDLISPEADGYILNVDRASLDATRFEDLVAAARELASINPQAAGDSLRKGLALWRGHPYDDVDGRTTIDAEIIRLSELRLAALEARIDADLAIGRHAELIGELDVLTTEYPIRERFRGQHMLALYRSARQAEALRGYQRTRTYLVEELGIEPSPELQSLEHRILDHDETLEFIHAPSIGRRALLVVDVDPAILAATLGSEARVEYLLLLDRAIRVAVTARDGEVFSERATSWFAAFRNVSGALQEAEAILRDMPVVDEAMSGPLVRIAVDVGDVEAAGDGGWTGPVVSRAASLVGAAHGGQVLISSDAQAEAVLDGSAGWTIRGLGDHQIARLDREEPVHQLIIDGIRSDFPPLRTDAIPPPLPGGVGGLAGYELREEIGRGPFGVVYRAYQPSVGREVAVKAINPELAGNPDFIRRFELEAQLIGRLEHPNIVPVYDYWRDPDGAYLVMRWIRGGSLRESLGRGTLSVQETGRLVAQIGSALSAAHGAGLLHQDIKPSNVLVGDDGYFYLSDFGVAASPESGGGPGVDIADFGVVVRRALGGLDGVPSGAAAAIERAESGGYGDVSSFVADWEDAVDMDIAAPLAAQYTPSRNPYKGLDPFTEADAPDFHGRSDVAAELVAKLRERRLVAAVGPSGIGKSSLVRAGLMSALRAGAIPGSERWLITDMVPGRYPFGAFASALLSVATTAMPGLNNELRKDRRGMVRAAKHLLPPDAELLIVVDQFEELFTIADETRRAAFLDALVTLVTDPNSNARVVITMRADFFDRPLRYAHLGEIVRLGTVLIAAPTAKETRSIIELPAEGVGVRFEPGLVDRILDDVATEPGALPLLEYSLTELFAGRDHDELTLASYEESGGVLAALGRRAEALYQDLDESGREASLSVFLRLVNATEASQDTRRLVRRSELERIEIRRGAVNAVLAMFGEYRLLTFDRDPITRGPTVEVAHEALFREWDRLARWIEEERADLVLHGQLRQAVEEWQASGRDVSFLVTGGRLTRHEEWIATTRLPLTEVELEFLATSRTREDARAISRRRRRRLVMIGFAAAALVAVVLAAGALAQRRDAVQERDRAAELQVEAETLAALAESEAAAADSAGKLALSRELALQSARQLEIDPERSMLLAIEAIEIGEEAGHEVPEATAALHRAVQSQRILARYPGGGFVAVSRDGSVVATAHDGGGVAVLDLESGEVVAVLERDAAIAIGAGFSWDGRRLGVVYAGATPPMWIWDLRNGEHVELEGGPIPAQFDPPLRVSFDPDGAIVTTFLVDASRVWNAVTGVPLYDIAILGDAVFSPAGNLLAVADFDGRMIRTLQPATGQETGGFAVDGLFPQFISLSPDGGRVAVISSDDRVFAVYDMASGQELARATVDRPQGYIAWLPDGDRVLVAGDAGVPRVFDAKTGEVQVELHGHQGVVWATASMPTNEVVVTAGRDDGSTIVWNVEAGSLPEVHKLVTGVPRLRNFAYVGAGEKVFVSGRGEPGTVMVIDAEDAEPHLVLEDQMVASGKETRPIGDASAVATVDLDGSSSIVSLTTAEVIYTAPAGLFVKQMTVAGDRALVAAKTFVEDPGKARTEIVDLVSGDTIALAGSPAVAAAEFSPDGSLVWTSAGFDSSFYDTSTGEEIFRLDVFNRRFMPNGETLVVIDLDGVLHLADLAGLRQGRPLEEVSRWQRKAHDSFTPLLVTNLDGTLIMSGGFNEPAKVWDATNGSLVAEFEHGLTSSSPRGQFHPTQPHVTLMSDGGTLLTFTLDTDELIDIARSRLTRDFSEAECRTYLHLESCGER